MWPIRAICSYWVLVHLERAMASALPILTDEDPRLRRRAEEVVAIDGDIRTLIGDLIATLLDFRQHAGFGRAIAAPQVGANLRIVAVHLGATPFALINPVITWKSQDMMEVWDDCLSVPGRLVRVQRHRSISLRYLDEHGYLRQWERLPPDLSELFQHEIDHLDGVLMLDRADGEQAIRPLSLRSQLPNVAPPQHRITLDGILTASTQVDPVFLHSPQFVCEPLSEALGCTLTLKVETLNPIRSFKGRGADHFMRMARARGDTRPMVCASAGNWGQAMAYVARKYGEQIDIFAAESVNPLKAQRMRQLGAHLHLQGRDFDEAKQLARAYCAEHAAWMIEDGLEPEISEGAGSIAVELLAAMPAPDAVLIPLGNGALLNGMARWIKAAAPATRVIGVVAAGAPAMARSWEAGQPIDEDQVSTIADGVAVRVPIPEAVMDMMPLVDEVRRVDDGTIVDAMRLVHRHAGAVIEPAGVLGIAALLADKTGSRGKRVATVLCGGNMAESDSHNYLFDAMHDCAPPFPGH
jgi:peptide deformylase